MSKSQQAKEFSFTLSFSYRDDYGNKENFIDPNFKIENKEVKIKLLDKNKVDTWKDKFFIYDTRVPDVWRYNYTKNGLMEYLYPDNLFKCSKFNDKEPQKVDEEITSIVLILESPHKDEYDYNNKKGEKIFEPIAPAQGTTGDNIDYHLHTVIGKIINQIKENINSNFDIPDNTPIIIANPIQWQTSMNFLYKKNAGTNLDTSLRDKVWRRIWKLKDIQDDFGKRLKSYNPLLIINACTSSLQPLIETFLKKIKNNIQQSKRATTHHPSYWDIKYNIQIK